MAFCKFSIFFLVIIGMALLMSTVESSNHHHHHHQHCTEPTDLRDQWNRLYTNHAMGELDESFYILPILREAAANHTRRYNFKKQIKRKVFNESSQCPSNDSEDFLHEGNPCPMYYELNTDPHRYPHILLEARCRCGFCQGFLKTTAKGKDYEPTCQEEVRYVKVLRRLPHCLDNVYQYAQAWEKLRIGCSCRLQISEVSN